MLPRRLLEFVGSTHPSDASEGRRLARASRDLGELDPVDFLSRAPGLPRGFWERGSSWQATVGVTVGVEVHAGPLPLRSSGRNGSDPPGYTLDRIQADDPARRVQLVRERVDEILASVDTRGLDEPVRLYGGLAFHPDHQADGAWTGFPTARFVLPALELVHDPKGTRLIATVRREPGQGCRGIDPAEQALDRATQALATEPAIPPEQPEPSQGASSDRQAWDAGVEEALARIHKGGLSKAVLARTLDVQAGGQPDPTLALRRLREQNRGSNIFYVEPRPGHAFLGAAPELIGTLRGRIFETEAVAGSVPRGSTPDQDDRLARELASSSKNREEHAIVVDWIRDRLAGAADQVEVGTDTRILRLNRVQHLERPLHARLDSRTHVLDLVELLHPTPAVGGTPVDAAMRLIAGVEPFERGWYAGPVGWFDENGDGTFAPGLRCAVLSKRTWRLFAGAGIVPGSQDEAEWNETNLKLEPVLRALDLPGVG